MVPALRSLAHRLLLTAATGAAVLLPARGAAAPSPISAVRTARPIALDGALDEDAWKQAPVFDAFVQTYPAEGAAPSQRTELRVLYDDANLYVGLLCLDTSPASVADNLGRRDNIPPSDLVRVAIDSAHDHRSAKVFTVNAAGVLADALAYDDTEQSASWDAVWDARVARRADGWSAELVIPLHLLRVVPGAEQRWGFLAHREIARTHEQLDSASLPRAEHAWVSRFNELVGLENLQPRADVALVPYVATRVERRPQFSADDRPHPRLDDPSADVGLDVRAALTPQLTLDATLNPDFGEVDPDQLLLNPSTFELYLPEKRPFFTQGLDLFQAVGSSDGHSPQDLFYSRRIGKTAPVLGALKLVGGLGDATQLGLLEATTLGPSAPAAEPDLAESHPDRTFSLHPERPLHLGPRDALPTTAFTPMNHAWGVVQQQLGSAATVRAMVASATPLEHCRDADCAPGGNAAALDLRLHDASNSWRLAGQLAGTQRVGGPPEGTVLHDGTLLKPGSTGAGGYVRAGKLGGSPFRFDVGYERLSPREDLNPTGFQPSQNRQAADVNLRFVQPNGLGPLVDFSLVLRGTAASTANGSGLSLYKGLTLSAAATLPGFHTLSCEATTFFDRNDPREISGSGMAIERPRVLFGTCSAGTDPNRALAAGATIFVGSAHAAGPTPGHTDFYAEGHFTWRPVPQVETFASVVRDTFIEGVRWVEDSPASAPRFEVRTPKSLAFTFRQQLVFTPRLTFQAFGQLFTSVEPHGQAYLARPAPLIHLADLQPLDAPPSATVRSAELDLSLVLRWEYRPGSTLFLIYTRTQEEPGLHEPIPTAMLPSNLGCGRAVDTLGIKLSYNFQL